MRVCQQGMTDRADHMHLCAKNFAEILTKRYLSKPQVEENHVPIRIKAHSNSSRHIPISQSNIPIKAGHAD